MRGGLPTVTNGGWAIIAIIVAILVIPLQCAGVHGIGNFGWAALFFALVIWGCSVKANQ